MTRYTVNLKQKNKKTPATKARPAKPARAKRSTFNKNTMEEVEVNRYALALMDPFHPSAGGAKVPDQYNLPTTTRTIRSTQTATVVGGAFLGLVTNNPNMAIAVHTGSLADGANLTAHNGVGMGSFWGINQASFAAQMDSYRIVGMGVRVTGLSSMTNASGKYVIGTFPSSSWAWAQEFALGGGTPQGTATPALTWKDWGIPYNAGSSNPNLLVNYPGNRVVSAVEMTENVFEVVPRMADPEALIFRPSSDSTVGPFYGFTGASAVTGNADYIKLKGFETTFIYVSGAADGATFDIEIIYHLEGRPNLSAGSPGQVLPINSAAPSPVAPVKFFQILTEAAKQPTVRQVIEDVAGFIHPMLGRIAGSLLHLF